MSDGQDRTVDGASHAPAQPLFRGLGWSGIAGLLTVATLIAIRAGDGQLTIPLSLAAYLAVLLLAGLMALTALELLRQGETDDAPPLLAALLSGIAWIVLAISLCPGRSSWEWLFVAALFAGCVALRWFLPDLLEQFQAARGRPEWPAIEPVSPRPIPTEDSPSTTDLHWHRQTRDGSDRLTGMAVAEFASGQKQAAVHVVFHPPFAEPPELTCRAGTELPPVRIQVGVVYRHGARFDLKREANPATPLRLPLHFSAHAHQTSQIEAANPARRE